MWNLKEKESKQVGTKFLTFIQKRSVWYAQILLELLMLFSIKFKQYILSVANN